MFSEKLGCKLKGSKNSDSRGLKSQILHSLELLWVPNILGEAHFLDSYKVVSDGLLLGKSLLLKFGFFLNQFLELIRKFFLGIFLGFLFGSEFFSFSLCLFFSSLYHSSVSVELIPLEFIIFWLFVDADGVDVLLEDFLELVVFQDLLSGVDSHLDFSLLKGPVWILRVIIVVNGAIGVLICQPE